MLELVLIIAGCVVAAVLGLLLTIGSIAYLVEMTTKKETVKKTAHQVVEVCKKIAYPLKAILEKIKGSKK